MSNFIAAASAAGLRTGFRVTLHTKGVEFMQGYYPKR
jgi:hypothetical protein